MRRRGGERREVGGRRGEEELKEGKKGKMRRMRRQGKGTGDEGK